MKIELLAPARTADIGTSAIRCGADAVYIGGPGFGARAAAGNSIADIKRLCDYAHPFGARVFATVNTIIYDDELDAAGKMMAELADAGVDALIVQDMAILSLAKDCGIPLHASTQCSIRTPERAAFLSSQGFERIVLEREMSLDNIRSISEVVPGCEIEFFVHGALCVCYSGQCYLSRYLTGRSANRGECAQPCRALYDLEDEQGSVIARNKAFLSLKDYCLYDRLQDLIDAGVSSFKIEGRLKNESYVRNVVAAYSERLDQIVAASHGTLERASRGCCERTFTPSLDKTFNRGYTTLFLDGRRTPGWSSMDTPKGMGEKVGVVRELSSDKRTITVKRFPGVRFSNGDGISFVAPGGGIGGFKADVAEGDILRAGRSVDGIFKGAELWRNADAAFEKEIASSAGSRMIDVGLNITLDGRNMKVEAGNVAIDHTFDQIANNPDRQKDAILQQLSKTAGIFRFNVANLYTTEAGVPFARPSELNQIRRDIADAVSMRQSAAASEQKATAASEQQSAAASVHISPVSQDRTYKANIANGMAQEFYGGGQRAYELEPQPDAELMRTKYCVRAELGLCPKQDGRNSPRPLVLRNNNKSLRLEFDCRHCEMTVKEK